MDALAPSVAAVMVNRVSSAFFIRNLVSLFFKVWGVRAECRGLDSEAGSNQNSGQIVRMRGPQLGVVGVGYQYILRSTAHSWAALLDSFAVRRKSLVLAERALPSHMAKLPRLLCRAVAYW